MKKFCVSFFVLFLISCSQDSVQSEVAVKKFNWSMVTTWPKNYPGLGMAPERFSKMVNEMSQGQLKITVYGAGEFVPAWGFRCSFFGLSGNGSRRCLLLERKVPAAQFFAGVPFGFTADEINAWVYRGGGLELWEEIYQPLTLNPCQEAIPARRCLVV